MNESNFYHNLDARRSESSDSLGKSSVAPTGPESGMRSFFPEARIADDDLLDVKDDESYEDEDESTELSSYEFMQNRELSWLTFDERVLDQGADESVPLLERLNFISIFWSNLQEFFMVRVGSLTDLSFIDPPVRDSKTGMTPSAQIKAIHERCRELYPIQESYYEHVRGSLAKQGVRHLRPDDLSDEQRNYLSGYVTFNVEPFLSPQIINPLHPFPHLENGKLYILLRLDDEADAAAGKNKKDKKGKKKKKDKGGAEGVVLGLIPLPHQCDRIIKLPGRGFQFILLEHAIEMFAPEVFSMYKIKHTNVICVTRNADIDANQTGDEQDEDYREHMKRLLKKRARLAPVRLECERPLSPVMEKLMLKKLGLKRGQVYDTIVPLDLSFTWGLGARLSESKRRKLSNPPFAPAWPVAFDRKRRILDQVTGREVLLSYPFESMDPFVQMLKEAAFDPNVISIKITLYRLASQSQLAEALITAAENGKSVTALFELRARFDESNNIEWSQRFEQAGCNVIYGFRDYKVHSKICCITRQLDDGSIQHITQLGTGNYNEKTAKLYTDLSFITTDEAFGKDAVEFFRNMQLENVSDNYEVLRVAPLQIKPMILENLDRQIELARAGKPCGAFMKANSITDKEVIEKIVEASQAGVGITLFIRGICCLVPEVKGFTDNVRVVSIVGRLLEHSRIYCFGTPDDCVMYLSSADLMTRNLNKRVEIAWPIRSEEIRWRILDYIDICLHDTAKLRELRPNATYTPLGAFCDLDEEGNAQPPFDAQSALIARAAAAAQRAEADSQARPEAEAQLPLTAEQSGAPMGESPAQAEMGKPSEQLTPVAFPFDGAQSENLSEQAAVAPEASAPIQRDLAFDAPVSAEPVFTEAMPVGLGFFAPEPIAQSFSAPVSPAPEFAAPEPVKIGFDAPAPTVPEFTMPAPVEQAFGVPTPVDQAFAPVESAFGAPVPSEPEFAEPEPAEQAFAPVEPTFDTPVPVEPAFDAPAPIEPYVAAPQAELVAEETEPISSEVPGHVAADPIAEAPATAAAEMPVTAAMQPDTPKPSAFASFPVAAGAPDHDEAVAPAQEKVEIPAPATDSGRPTHSALNLDELWNAAIIPAQPTPVVEELPLTEDQPVAEESVAVEEQAIAVGQPVVEQLPVTEGMPVAQQQSASEETPVIHEPVPVVAPAIQEPVPVGMPAMQEPIAAEVPVVQEPIPVKTPVVQEPALGEMPAVQEPPVFEEPPVQAEQQQPRSDYAAVQSYAEQATDLVSRLSVRSEQVAVPTDQIPNMSDSAPAEAFGSAVEQPADTDVDLTEMSIDEILSPLADEVELLTSDVQPEADQQIPMPEQQPQSYQQAQPQQIDQLTQPYQQTQPAQVPQGFEQMSQVPLGQLQEPQDFGQMPQAQQMPQVQQAPLPEQQQVPWVQPGLQMPQAQQMPQIQLEQPQAPLPGQPQDSAAYQPQQGVSIDAQDQDDEQPKSFFDSGSRDIEMPPEKKGLFSRFHRK